MSNAQPRTYAEQNFQLYISPSHQSRLKCKFLYHIAHQPRREESGAMSQSGDLNE
jgi:hypothetical protein